MSTRCPKCGKINYGDMQKCSFCGSPLKFIPGEEIPTMTESDIQEKISKLDTRRIRNPYMISGGGASMVIGAILAIVLTLVFMLFAFATSDIESSPDGSSLDYRIPGGEEYIFGEITREEDFSDNYWASKGLDNYGYRNHTAYEIDGDGIDQRWKIYTEVNTFIGAQHEGDVWVYSEEDLGDPGDTIFINVRSERNEHGEIRGVYDGGAAWGGSGWMAAWVFAIWGILVFIGGGIILTIGLIGKADRSIERLIEEDQEFRRQQMSMIHAAKMQATDRQKQEGWYSTEAYATLQDGQTPEGGSAQPAGPYPQQQPAGDIRTQQPYPPPPQPLVGGTTAQQAHAQPMQYPEQPLQTPQAVPIEAPQATIQPGQQPYAPPQPLVGGTTAQQAYAQPMQYPEQPQTPQAVRTETPTQAADQGPNGSQ